MGEFEDLKMLTPKYFAMVYRLLTMDRKIGGIKKKSVKSQII
jgi:hypothetical protein